MDAIASRQALLELHRLLLEVQRRDAERFSGRMSASELLQAAAEDLRFAWLRELSEAISALDVAEDRHALDLALDRVRDLVDPPDEGTAFGARYLHALQQHPDVVFAHRDLVAALGRERPRAGG